MVFSSNIFLFLFLPLFLLIYYAVGSRWRSLVIVAGSYAFYSWWRPDFLLLFVAITYWNFWFALKIKSELNAERKKVAFRWLTIGVVGNLATLGYFKYANFGVEVFTSILQPLGIETFTLEYIILPLGISFYIFQAISYIVDIYRKQAEPAKNFIDFAAYIALFPQLIAGPIVRYRYIDIQFRKRTHSLELFSLGASRFMLGFVKKVLIADSLAPMSAIFLTESEPQMIDAWIGLLASVLQLYFDFSGYSDMAIGLGMMMGFRFPENFNQPYLSQSITEFWQRWHMTLADFLRDYVYMPLVRRRIAGAMLALVYTMFLSGFWHGASFSFIFWGLFFGISMVLERKLGIATKVTTPYRFSRNLRTFILLNLSMPLFFTGSLSHSMEIYAGMLGINGMGNLESYFYSVSINAFGFMMAAIIWMLVSGVINLRYYANSMPRTYFMSNVSGFSSMLLWVGFFLALSRLSANSFSPFLYFQF